MKLEGPFKQDEDRAESHREPLQRSKTCWDSIGDFWIIHVHVYMISITISVLIQICVYVCVYVDVFYTHTYIYLEPLCSPFWIIDLYYGLLCNGLPIIRPFVKNTVFAILVNFLKSL